MKRRLVSVGVIALVVAVFAAGRWACDATIRDQRLIDQLVRDATWWFPPPPADAARPAMQRVHAAQTRSGRMGGRQEHVYVEFARPKELEQFIAGATTRLDEANAKLPGRWKWEITRDVRLSGAPPSSEAPPWWPGPRRAHVVLNVHQGATLIAPAGPDGIFIWYFVP